MKLMEEIILTSFIKLNQIQVIQNNSKIWKIYHNNKTKINYLTKIFIWFQFKQLNFYCSTILKNKVTKYTIQETQKYTIF